MNSNDQIIFDAEQQRRAEQIIIGQAASAPKPDFKIDLEPEPESALSLNHHLRTCYGAGLVWPPL